MTRTEWIIAIVALLAGMTVWVKLGVPGLLWALVVWSAGLMIVALLWARRGYFPGM